MNSLRAKPRLCFSALLLLGAGVCVAVPVVADEPSLPKPVRIGEDATAEKSDVRPVTIGEGTATQKSDVAPVKVGGTAKDNSPVGIEPVTLGAGAKTTKPDLSALKVGGVAALGGVNIAAVTASSLRVPLLLGQVSSGAATVESLLQSGALKPADLLWAAHHPGLWMEKAPVQQTTPGTIEVYDAFLARFDEQVVGAVEWERPARAALAAELSRRGDARCVPLFEAMTADWVEEWKRDGGRKIDGTVPGLHALAWYYQAKDEKLKAARTYEMSEQYSVAPAWVGSALVEAARLYRDVGQKEKSEALYAQVAQYGNGLLAGLALYDQAALLISQGRHKDARELLNTPVEGTDANQSKVALLSLQASSYYQTGEFEVAQLYAQQCVAQSSAVKVLSGKGLEQTVSVAEEIYKWSAQWTKNPITVGPKSAVKFLFSQGSLQEKATRRVLVRTFRDVPLVVTTSDRRVEVRVLDEQNYFGQRKDYYVQKRVEIEVLPQEVTQDFSVTLTVSSPQIPEYQVQLPIYIEVEKPA